MMDAVMLAVPPGVEVTFRAGPGGSVNLTLTPSNGATPAPEPEPAPEFPVPDKAKAQRAAKVARRGRPAGRGKGRGGHGVSGAQWRSARKRNAAIRAFGAADSRFTRRDYRTPGVPGGREGYYIS